MQYKLEFVYLYVALYYKAQFFFKYYTYVCIADLLHSDFVFQNFMRCLAKVNFI